MTTPSAEPAGTSKSGGSKKPVKINPKTGKPFHPLRRNTGTAAHHLSKRVNDFSLADLETLSVEQANLLMAEITWGSSTEMCCPHCCTFDSHYFYRRELRWKCKACDKKFSVTSKTVFADRKMPLLKIMKTALNWANGSSGTAAIKVMKDWGGNYCSNFTALHKLREGLMRGNNTGILCGVQEMDGLHFNGRRHEEKRNAPLRLSGPRVEEREEGATPPAGAAEDSAVKATKATADPAVAPTIPTRLLKPVVPAKETIDPETGEVRSVAPAGVTGSPSSPSVPTAPGAPSRGEVDRLPPDRRILLTIRQRSVAKGRGGVLTRVAVARREVNSTVTAMATRRASADSGFETDESSAYADFHRQYVYHATVPHKVTHSGPNGENNNQAESFNMRVRFSFEAVYRNVSNKYALDYACENAWREDTRRMSNGTRLRELLRVAMSVGPSQFWRGYSHGRHRGDEFLVEGQTAAKPRGRPKNWQPKPPR